MLEQFIAPNYYELMKVLATSIDPAEFPLESVPKGLIHFKLKEKEPGVYIPIMDERVFTDDMEFMHEVSSRCRFFGFVKVENGQTFLGFRAPILFGEYLFVDGKWVLQEYEDFRRRKKTPAELRFEVSQDFEAMKKFLAKS